MTNYGKLELHEAPATEPLTLADVKKYLRIDGDNENELLNSMISAATKTAEEYLGVSIIDQAWKLSFDKYTLQEVKLSHGPVKDIEAVKLIAEDGTETEFDDANYYLTAGNRSIYFKNVPSANVISIIYNTGYSDEAEETPELIRQGVFAIIASMYEKRNTNGEISDLAKSFFNFYREIKL